MVIFNSYVSLPEGKSWFIPMIVPWHHPLNHHAMPIFPSKITRFSIEILSQDDNRELGILVWIPAVSCCCSGMAVFVVDIWWFLLSVGWIGVQGVSSNLPWNPSWVGKVRWLGIQNSGAVYHFFPEIVLLNTKTDHVTHSLAYTTHVFPSWPQLSVFHA